MRLRTEQDCRPLRTTSPQVIPEEQLASKKKKITSRLESYPLICSVATDVSATTLFFLSAALEDDPTWFLGGEKKSVLLSSNLSRCCAGNPHRLGFHTLRSRLRGPRQPHCGVSGLRWISQLISFLLSCDENPSAAAASREDAHEERVF